jgi:DNA polymerase alpha subunit A
MERERRKRPKHDAKLSAFERLKQVKASGIKNKCEVGEVENVYEEISEKEYTERVLQRQEDDWIVGDG